MAKFNIIPEDEKGEFFTIKEIPVFEMHTDRGFACDAAWMADAIKSHEHYASQDWRPPIIIGHNIKGAEKESVGFLDNLRLKGARLYADMVRVPREIVRKFKRNAWPSRSVEVLPKAKRILALALLGGTAPHFALPQVAYGLETDEEPVWYRSPTMGTNMFTDEQRKELFGMVSEAVTQAVPVALQEALHYDDPDEEDDGEGEGEGEDEGEYSLQELVEMYANPKTPPGMKEKLMGLIASGRETASGAAQSARFGARRLAGRVSGARGGGRSGPTFRRSAATAGGKIAGAARLAGRTAREHAGPIAALAGGGAVAGAGAGYAVGRGRKRRRHEYALDENNLMLYDEQGNVVGHVVPTAPDPTDLPPTMDDDPSLEADEGAVGVGSGIDSALQNDPGEPETDLVEEVGREDSDQFASREDIMQYDLQRRVDTLETANALLQTGRKAEQLKTYLLQQQQSGTPIKDVEQTLAFMMSLDDGQLETFQKQLESSPKVSLGRISEDVVTNYDLRASEIKEDYNRNRTVYRGLGVTEEDMKYADFVRTGPFNVGGNNDGIKR